MRLMMNSFYRKFGKRFLDILLSFIALMVLSPIIFIEIVVTLIELGRPVLFLQIRAGRDGKPFLIYKFRNMNNKTDENGVPLPPELRVSKSGKFFRATSLDEILQLINIIKGDMSIIGPRPLPMRYTELYSERHKKRLAVRPGLECPIMDLNGRFNRSFHNQFENDVWYTENVGLITDIKVMLMLVRLVFDRKSASVRSAGTSGTFIGYKDGIAITDKLSQYDKGTLERQYWRKFIGELESSKKYMKRYIPYPELRDIA